MGLKKICTFEASNKNKLMKILFLDFDGVITIPPTWNIKTDKIKFIKKIVDSTGAKIVVSSSWRCGCPPTIKETVDKMIGHPKRCPQNRMINWLIDNLYDCTPCYSTEQYKLPFGGRGGEIQAWLNAHPDVENYVILDDDGDMDDSQLFHFVQTNYEDGITDAETERAIKVLNRCYIHNSLALNFVLRFEWMKKCEGLENRWEKISKFCDICKEKIKK